MSDNHACGMLCMKLTIAPEVHGFLEDYTPPKFNNEWNPLKAMVGLEGSDPASYWVQR